MLAVSVVMPVLELGLLFVQETITRATRARIKIGKYRNDLRIFFFSIDKNKEIIAAVELRGLPPDQVHDRFFIADPDGNGGLFELDGITIDRPDMPEGDDIGFVDADELPCRKGLFQVIHGLVGDQRIVGRIDLEVILHSLNIQDLGKIDPEEFAVGADKNMIVLERVRFLAGRGE
jgi:hypothetical protein